MKYFNKGLISVSLVMLLSACATSNTSETAPAAASTPKTTSERTKSDPVAKAEASLAEGIELYDQGDFKAAIRKLQSAKDESAESSAVQQTSLKYLAFSYCVTGQKALCKTQFVSLLKMVPSFQLSRAEAGHPLWGPVFKEARAAVKAPATTTASK